ncbi:CdaR family transcriptional regulator [Oceanobacillus senegalensis]|uniref:CdaR family transcriptional regulator n=1 Tax=Oceanobacillus senegalensis TaxID=1936063 RepID=UPI000A30448C|nr:sugar diacid recognition domain-containing protein [Oceanobacillus senegalensis]
MLTRKIAEIVVKEASLRVNRNVNIMNRNGKIIATCDPSRLNHIHQGALKVIQSGEPLFIHYEVEDKLEGVKSGVNLPIVFHGETIGVIGVTGDPREISEIGELVKMMTELMITQEYATSQHEWKQTTKDMLLEQLLKKEPSYDDIDQLKRKLDCQFVPIFVTTIIQIEERSTSTSNQRLLEHLENAIGHKNGLLGVIHVNRLSVILTNVKETDKKIKTIYNVLKSLNIHFRMAYSLPFENLENFRESYLDCDLALNVTDTKNEVISFAQIEAKALVYRMNHQISQRFARRVLHNLDEANLKTLESFFNHNLHIQKAANELYVHRNTLIYRLNKITEQTGIDPRKFEGALSLQVAIWIHEHLDNLS